MKSPIFVRALTEGEREHLHRDLRSSEAFRLKRAQIILASEQQFTARQIAETYGACSQTVRNIVRAFNQVGLECLTRRSNRPKRIKLYVETAARERLQQILHQSPRTFGKDTSLWSQALLAEVAYEQGLTSQLVSRHTMRRALRRLNANWKRAKHWITSPDPQYALKKSGESA